MHFIHRPMVFRLFWNVLVCLLYCCSINAQGNDPLPIHSDNKEADGLFQNAVKECGKGRWEEAVKFSLQAIETDPEFIAATLVCGEAYWRLAEAEKEKPPEKRSEKRCVWYRNAEENFNKAKALLGGSRTTEVYRWVYYNLARVCYSTGRYNQAAQYMADANGIATNTAVWEENIKKSLAIQNQAVEKFSLGKWAEGEEILNQLVKDENCNEVDPTLIRATARFQKAELQAKEERDAIQKEIKPIYDNQPFLYQLQNMLAFEDALEERNLAVATQKLEALSAPTSPRPNEPALQKLKNRLHPLKIPYRALALSHFMMDVPVDAEKQLKDIGDAKEAMQIQNLALAINGEIPIEDIDWDTVRAVCESIPETQSAVVYKTARAMISLSNWAIGRQSFFKGDFETAKESLSTAIQLEELRPSKLKTFLIDQSRQVDQLLTVIELSISLEESPDEDGADQVTQQIKNVWPKPPEHCKKWRKAFEERLNRLLYDPSIENGGDKSRWLHQKIIKNKGFDCQ